ncbi:hypothetical protein KEM56_001062 [Ascosphaera pollenicola]|nr:hypothetical protein KEM56_001062 [Ascosphaera pollenicola]
MNALASTVSWILTIYVFVKVSNVRTILKDSEEENGDAQDKKHIDHQTPDGDSHATNVYGAADIEGASDTDEEDDEDILFIPLGYPKVIPGEYYSGTDPEWLAFAKIAQDTKALSATKESLVKLVSDAASKNPALATYLGDPVQLMSYWIMHEFPYRAPPEYVRSGIEIGPDYIGWVSRVVPNEEAEKIKSMYNIEGLKEPLLEAWKLVLGQGLNKVRNALGLEETPSHTTPSPTSGFSPQWVKNSGDLEIDPSSTSLYESNRHTQEPQSTPARQQDQQDPQQPQLPSILRNPLYRDFSRPSPGTTPDPSSVSSTFPTRRLLDAADPDFDISEATAAYRRMASKAKSKFVIPPRGVFRLHGLVGLRGSKGQASIYASGYYQPQEKKWFNLSIELVSLIPVEQRPKGVSRSS